MLGRLIIISVLLLNVFSVVSAQTALLEFRGQVLSESDSMPIPFVNIYTQDYETFASSSASGFFSMEVLVGDTINFSAVGFKPKQIIAYGVPGLEQPIFLNQVTYELPGLVIYGKNAMEGFFDHNRLYNPETKRTFSQKFPKPQLGISSSGAGVTGLLTLLANQFNSEYKQLKKLEKIEKDEYKYFRRLELIFVRLNPDYIVQNTSLDRDEVEEFIDFWNPSLAFMESADGYQLLTAVQKKEDEFIKQIKMDNQGKNVVSTIELRKLLDNYKGNE